MEIINDNFILLDSDVLLKKDISDLYDDNVIYTGEIITQPLSNIKRVLPYVCFINTKKCKENNVHYFNDDYMHGLYKTIKGDRYDTGAGFFIEAHNFQHKEIKSDEYIIHYKAGSWDNNAKKLSNYTQKLSIDEWLELNKKYWFFEKYISGKMDKDYKKELKKYCNDKHKNVNIDNPKTIQDKINWLKVNDLSPLKTKCADKIKVHEYCKEKLGKDICIPIIKIYNSADEIKWDELPDKFVMKCNHGSGMNIIVKDKSKINKLECISKLNTWMKRDFAFQNGYEMHYHNIEHKIFIEKYLFDSNQISSLYDYKFWCFNGKPNFFTINDGNGHGKWMNFYDLDGNLLPYKRVDFLGTPTTEINIPIGLKTMIEYSKKLSEDFKFVRVDFYEVNGEVYLGEMTFTPGSGFFRYKNSSDDLKIGELLDLGITKNNNKVVYTCITGGYDSLLEPEFISEGFDYVCFTDDSNIKSDVWQIKPLPEETKDLSQVKKQRFVKINPHLLLKEYDLSIWVDGNVEVKNDLNDFISKKIKEDDIICVPTHPQRKCIYDEERVVLAMKKDVKENTQPQIERYKKEGFPKEYGLLQSNILVRRHNNTDCIKLMEDWFEEVKNGSHRDQLSFNYVAWKNKDIKITYLDKYIYKSQWFKWHTGHKKSKPIAKTNPIINRRQIIKNEKTPAPKTVSRIIPRSRRAFDKPNTFKTQNIGIYRI